MADPALLFHDPSDRDGTHVLLIGIGDYPWLEDGADYDPALHDDNAMGMGQLAAPATSIRRLADWFLDSQGFDNAERPLASLAMLLSEPTPARYDHPRAKPAARVPRGTVADVEKAVEAWVERASGRRGNALVFAFCGHGLQSGNPVLLCRDYGRSRQNRFKGAIDFEQFRIALSTRQPDQQLLLVDACRTPDAEAELLGQATPGNPLLSIFSLAGRDSAPAQQSVHFATSLYTPAWGRADGATLFNDALLAALTGGGADQTAEWWVTTSRLHSALATYLARISSQEGIVQRPAAQTQDFRICKPERIAVPLYITANEPDIWKEEVWIDAMRGGALAHSFTYKPPAGTGNPGATPCALRLVNPTQRVRDVIYGVSARFAAASRFSATPEEIIAYPPEVTCELRVSKQP
ncbi:hypothetical protein J3E64_000696 [Sphingobium sp. OAS761]|nr:hypothetical protein [Sphingobium sp. OAS761]